MHQVTYKYNPKLENADVVSAKKSDLARWAWLVGLVAFASMVVFMAIWAEAQKAPETPKALGASTSTVPDPCGLADVECPGEATSKAVASQAKAQKVITATVYTYQAVASQTDGDPCHTADGTDLCDPVVGIPPYGIVANNCLAFGTEVQIRGESYFVHDRMNTRYGCDTFDVLTVGETFKLINEPVTILNS